MYYLVRRFRFWEAAPRVEKPWQLTGCRGRSDPRWHACVFAAAGDQTWHSASCCTHTRAALLWNRLPGATGGVSGEYGPPAWALSWQLQRAALGIGWETVKTHTHTQTACVCVFVLYPPLCLNIRRLANMSAKLNTHSLSLTHTSHGAAAAAAALFNWLLFNGNAQTDTEDYG